MRRWREALRRGVRGVRRTGSVLTPGGRAVLALAVVGYAGAREAGLDELAVVAVVAALLLVAALPFVLLPTRVRARVVLRPTHTVAGETGAARLHVENRLPLPLLHPEVRLPVSGGADRRDAARVRLPVLARGHEVVVEVPVPTRRRGVVDVGPVTARRTDPLGLLRREARWGAPTPLYVRPRMVSLEGMATGFLRDQEGVPSDEVSMEDLAFHALREYVRGDDLRHVHWRSSARAGQLLVRQYHQTRRRHAAVLVDDDPASYADAEDFELAVSVAASLVVRAALDQAEITFVCGREVVSGAEPAEVLDACCRVELLAGGTRDLAERAGVAARLALDATVLVVSGGAAAQERLRTARSVFGSGGSGLVFRAARAGDSGVASDDAAVVVRVARLGDLPALLTGVAGLTAVTR